MGGLSCALGRAAAADQFALLPAGDPAYTQLATVSQAGWLDNEDGSTVQEIRPADKTLTRYEVSLEVARAIIAVTAHAEADPSWAAVIPRKPARALRDLATGFRTELKSLGVDPSAAQKELDAVLQPISGPFGAHSTAASTPSKFTSLGRTNNLSPGDGNTVRAGRPIGPRMAISQRLRVSAAVSELARDADDLFGDAAFGTSAGLARKGSVYVPGAVPTRAGVAVGVTDWLTLRANYASQHLAQPPVMPSLLGRSSAFYTGADAHALGGSINVDLLPNVKLSGDVQNVTGERIGSAAWRQMGGQLGWTGWQNRLSLKANMSRLVPEDTRLLPSTLFGLNVGLDIGQRLSLTLLYQQMFSAPVSSAPNQLVAGGVSIHF